MRSNRGVLGQESIESRFFGKEIVLERHQGCRGCAGTAHQLLQRKKERKKERKKDRQRKKEKEREKERLK